MLTFLNHKGNEIGALTTFNYTNSVNGERSLSGTVHGNLEIEKGWGVRFEDEYYKVIYAKPKSLGKINIVQFDAVHQFFWDFDKSSVYSELDGSYPFQTFLDHIFNGSGYRYNLEVEVGSLRKQNFGLKKRLELFNDLMKHAGVEFQVRGKVVRILERTGTDLSTVVRKKLNLNDLSIEKRIGDFITYQKGLGAWHDENDHSKGRLEVEYVSPLASIYGRLEGEPYVDERFTIAENFLGVLKKSVEDSYSISVQLAMEDLQKAGYRYTRPLAGDYITVIDEDINFKERVRIVSFETKYDVKGQVIDHTVTCNDIGSVKKQSAGYSSLKSSVANVSKETESAIQTANRALVSADGKTTVYFGTEFPQDVPKGTLTKGDTLYLTVGDTTKMYYWNGAEWIEPPVVNDVERFKRDLAEEIAQVNQSMQAQSEEHDRQVADILSKTQSVESLANQAKSDAASAITQALQFKNEAIAEATRLDTVERQATETKLATAKSQAISEATRLVETAKSLLSGQISNVSTDLIQTKEAIKLLATKATVDTLTGRVSSAEAMIQVQADQISQRVKTSDFDQAKQRISTAESSIIQIGNRITTEISETKALIPSNLGGTNLIRGSKWLKRGSQGWSQGHWRSSGSGGNVEYNVPLPSSPIKGITTGAKITSDSSNQIGLCQDGTSLEAGTYTLSVWVLGSSGFKVHVSSAHSQDAKNPYTAGNKFVTLQDSSWTLITQTFTLTKRYSNLTLAYLMLGSPGTVYYAAPYIHKSTLPGDWSPAPEDYDDELSSVKTTITQTASGVEQLSTSLTTTDSKVTTAEAKIRQLISDVSSKVSQTDYNTLTGRVDSAETAITQNATEISKRLTSTQVDKAITDKGYQTKSDVDNNITGRGYITSSALQPYALSTTVQNLVQETAGSFERQITETRGLIPAEVNQNLFDVVFSDLRATGGASFVQSDDGWIEVTIKNRWSGFHWYYSDDINPSKKQYVVSYEAYLVDTVAETARLESDFGSPNQLTLINKTPKRYTVVLNRPVNIFNYINFVCDSSETGKKFRIRNIKLEEGIVATPYIAPFPTTVLFNAVKDTVDAHKQLIGNGDSISQAIQSANKFERYISSGGDIYQVIETAAGLVQEVSGANGLKTQVSQLAGSYAIKNLTNSGTVLNQLNLNKDGSVKIDGKLVQITGTTYIQDGVITSAKIGSLDAGKITTGTLDAARIAVNSIDGSKMVFDQAFVNKMTANQAYLKKLFAKDAFLTAVQAVTLSASQIIGGLMRATNGAMEIDFNNSAIDMFKDGAIRFHSGSNAIYRQSADGTHTAFVHFDTTSKGGIYASLGSTSSRDGINSKSSGRFAGIRAARTSERSDSHVASQDAVELYGDTIFFGHGFEGGGFSMHTTLTGGQTISLNKMHDALINLCRCWIHLRDEGFNLNSQAFRKSLDIEIHNAQQLYNTIERIT